MLVLWEEQGISVKTLGDKLFLDSGTLTPLPKAVRIKGIGDSVAANRMSA